MDIKQIITNHIMIFKIDEINLQSLRRAEAINILNLNYQLKNLQYPNNLGIQTPNIIYIDGEFKHEGKTYLINEVVIDSRKIIIKLMGPSNISELFFNQLREDFKNLDIRNIDLEYKPLISTYETQCILKLDIDMKELIAGSKLETFFKNSEKLVPKFEADHIYIPYSFKFKIGFLNLPENIIKNKLSLSEKFIVLEQREQTNPEENIFFTSSPADYETHIKILEGLESLFK